MMSEVLKKDKKLTMMKMMLMMKLELNVGEGVYCGEEEEGGEEN